MFAQNHSRLLLREASPSDVEQLSTIRSDTELQHQLMAHPVLVEPSRLIATTAEWMQRRINEGWFRVIDDGSGPVGFVQLTDIHRKNRSAWLGIAIKSAAQGKKLGKKALAELEQNAKVDLRLRKLMLQVRSDNDRAIFLYSGSGWRVVGTLLAHYDDGEALHDVVVMEKSIV